MPTAVFIDEVTREEVARALRELSGERPVTAVLACLPEGADVHALQDACNDGGIRLGGAVFPALVVEAELRSAGAVLLDVGDAPPPRLFEGAASPVTAAAAMAALADFVEAEAPPAASIFCVFDGLDPMIASHLDRLYQRLGGRVGYWGVNAGSERFVSAPCLFDNDRFVAGGVLVQLLPGRPGACLDHGFRVPERVSTATTASGNRVVQIDRRPAIDVYREMILSQYGVTVDRHSFYTLAVNFPLAILRSDGEMLVRIPVALDEEGGILCVGEVPPSAVLTLLDARAKDHDASTRLAKKLKRQGCAPGETLLLFYCAGRRLQRGADVPAELLRVMRATEAAHCYGSLTLGEIATSRAGGYPVFHNAAILGMPWHADRH